MFKTKRDVDRHVTHILNKIREEKERNSRGFQFAKLYFDVGDYPSSKRYVQAFLSVRETVPQAHKLLGQIHDALKEKSKAIESYKRSLDLDPDQNDLVLKVCELYGDVEVKASPETVQYWIDRAEKHCPDHNSLFKLKERLIDQDGSTDREELENLISKELLKNPGDVQLHMKLLRLFMKSREVKSAYEHVLKTERTLAFVSSVEWYECLSEVYQVYQDQHSCTDDVTFYTYKLFSLTTLAFLRLRSEERDLVPAMRVIHQLDQDLLECSNIQKQTADWTSFLTEMKGQLFYLIALMLLKRALKGQTQWKDATTYGAVCFLLSDALPAVDLKSGWYRQVPKDSRKFYERVQMLGYDRLSQGGHMIHELKKDEPGWVGKLRQRLWTPQGREGLYSLLFTSPEMRPKKSTSFLLQDTSLANANFQLPGMSQLNKYDSVAFALHADSLNHLVWLALRYVKKDDIQPDYEQLFQCQLYPSLKLNSTDVSSGDPSSLSQLDVQVFLYACVKWTSFDLREKKRSLHNIVDKPDLLPVCLMPSLCTRPQSEWWNAVYKMESKSSNAKLSQLWGVVVRGLETIRLVSPHTMSLSMVVLLARNVDSRVREMESVEADVVTPKLSALQSRAAYYWHSASDMLKRMDRNLSVKLPKEMLFPDNSGSSPAQNKELREQVCYAMALISMRDERYEDALDGFKGLCMPEAAFYTGLIYRQMAENMNTNDNSANDTQMTLLTRAKDSLYQALDRLESDKNEELKSNVKQELDDVVCKLIAIESGGTMVDSILSATSPNYSTAESEVDDTEEAVAKQPSIRTPVLTTPSRSRESQRISPTRIDVQLRALETTNSALSSRLNTIEETVRANVKHIQQLVSQLHEARDDNRALRSELQMVAFQGLSNMSMPRPPVPPAFQATPQARNLLNTMNNSFGTGLPYEYGTPGAIPPHMSQYGYPVAGGSPRPGSAFGPQTYEEDFNNVDGEYYDPDIDYVSDQNLVQEWPFGHKAVAEGKSTITYSPQHQGVTPGVPPGVQQAVPQGVPQCVAQGVPTNPANSGMFANALRGPSLQYGNFQQAQTSLPMPGPGFFSQPSPAGQPSTVHTQAGLFPSPGQLAGNMAPKAGISPGLTQPKAATPTQPPAQNRPASSIMPPNAVASQSTENKPKLIQGSVGVPTPKKDQGAHLTPTVGQMASSPGQLSPSSAAATLSQLAARHQESSQTQTPPTVNVPTATPQKTVFQGFSFTSTPKITDPKKNDGTQAASTAAAAPKPFSGFSFSVPTSKPAPSQPQVAGSPFMLGNQSGGTTMGMQSIIGSSPGQGIFAASPSSRRQNLSAGSDDHTDEYEPNVDFKPVVPLPDLVEVKTGEEEEDQMFCERAKLFRYDAESSQWKERGIGEMKILKHKQTKVVRILMRRDQVLKLCANHRISKDMKLTPMASSDKACVWDAMDFSEEEMKYEKLACKFKNADIASKFKIAFENCQQEQSDVEEEVKKVEDKPKPKDVSSAKPAPLSAMFKPKPGAWTCDGCFLQNSGEVLECPCCKSLKPGVKKEDIKSAAPASSGISVQPGGGFTFGGPAAPGTGNSAGGSTFGAPSVAASSTSGSGFSFGGSTNAAASTAPTSGGFKFSSSATASSAPSGLFGTSSTTAAPSGGFKFGSPATASSDAATGGFKFNTGATTATAATKSEDTAKSLPFNIPEPCKPTSGFTLGGAGSSKPSTESTGQSLLAKVLSEDSTSNTSGFSFTPGKPVFGGSTDLASKSDASKPMFGSASSGPANDFSFSLAKPTDPATPNKSAFGSAFTFSMSMTPTQSTTSPAKGVGITSPTSPAVNEEGYYVNKEEDDIHFEPVIALPDKVEIKTGEEDEEVVFVHRAKLFRFASKEWRERGLGEMKILFNKETMKARLLMRREHILKMCCNHSISPDLKFTPMPNSKGCALVWYAMDFSEDEGKSEQFSIKFKTPEIVDNFLKGIEEARKRCSGEVESVGAASAGSNVTTATDDDDDVIFVKEEKASPEDVKKAQAFMLPDGFYLYLKRPPCPGCRGCEDRMPEDDDITVKKEDEKESNVSKSKEEEDEEEVEEEEEEDDDEEEEDDDDEDTDEYDSETGDTEVKVPVFGMGSQQPTFGDVKGKSSSQLVFGGTNAGFSFSDVAKAADPNAFRTDENKPFAWQGAGRKLFGAGGGGGGGGEEGGEDDVEQGDEPQFEPVIALPDLVEVKTGEEDEMVEYAQRSKLFRFDSDTNQWKEKGIGEMKILKHKESCRYRLLMRREQVHKLACNHLLTPDLILTPLATSETSWCWSAQDFSGNEGQLEKLAIKFKTTDLAHEFKKKFEACQEILRTQSTDD